MDEFLGRLIEELQPYLNEDEIAYDVKVMVNNGVTENRIALRKDNAPTGPTIRVACNYIGFFAGIPYIITIFM